MHRTAAVGPDKHPMCPHCSTFIIGITHVRMYNIYIMTTVYCTREMHWRNRDSILYSYNVCVCVCVKLVGFDEKAIAVCVCVT